MWKPKVTEGRNTASISKRQCWVFYRTTFGSKTKQDSTSHIAESVNSIDTHLHNDTPSQSVSQPSNVPTTNSPTNSIFSKADGRTIPHFSIDDNIIFICSYTISDSLSIKVDELDAKLYQLRHDICAVTEILPKFSSSIWIDQHYRIKGYQIYLSLNHAPVVVLLCT